MSFQAHVLKVLIASPGDTADERDGVTESIGGWNASRAEAQQVVLLPWRYEKHAVPTLDGPAQSVINAQAVDQSDILIAIFDSRLGQATADAVSGTAEEIKRAADDGKPVHVYFSNEPISRDADPGQLAALKAFKTSLESEGLLGEYANVVDLQYKVRDAIEHDVTRLGLGAPVMAKKAGAEIRCRYNFNRIDNGYDRRGQPKYRDYQRLYVENIGDATAEGLHLEIVPVGGQYETVGPGEEPWRWTDDPTPETPFDLKRKAERFWGFIPLSKFSLQITARWREGDVEHEEIDTISVV